MNRIIERLSSFGVVPVVALDHSCTAASVAKALIAADYHVRKSHFALLRQKKVYIL